MPLQMANPPKQGVLAFFKILIDPSAPYLPLPPDFVTKYLKNKIPQNPTLKTEKGELSWQLKITKIGGKYCFAHGWKSVVKDAHLGFGDLLVFWQLHPSIFQVSVFGPNGCLKDLSSDKANLKCEFGGERRNALSVKNVIKIEDDDDVDDDGDINSDVQEDDDADNDDDEYHDDEDVSLKITISEKTHKSVLRLPKKFVKDSGIDSKTSITIRDLQGRQWHTPVQTARNLGWMKYYLSSGWRFFRRYNPLLDGDTCVFKFEKRESQLTLVDVIRKKAAADEGQLSCDDKSPPETETVKRKRGRPRLTERLVVDVERCEDELESVPTEKSKRGRPSLRETKVVYF